MDIALLGLVFLFGLIFGALLVWLLILQPRVRKMSEVLSSEQGAKEVLLIENAKTAEKLELALNVENKFKDAFEALSAEALKSNNQAFLDLAKLQLEKYQEGAKHDLDIRQKSIDDLLKPVAEGLTNVNQRVIELDKARAESHAALNEQVKNLILVQSNLQNETSNLVNALRFPKVRGRWGELALRNVVEMAGMLEHCDFAEQLSVKAEDGLLRPDLTINLPGNKNMVVDSKMPFEAFMKAVETINDEEAKAIHLKEHARQVRDRLSELSSKNYWRQFPNSPEFVILFLPTESLFSAALEYDPELIQMGWQKRVLMATPTTLIALLRAVAYGWNSEALSRNATAISDLGKELHGRIAIFADHFIQLRKSIEGTVKTYNDTAASLESRVLVTARKFNDLSISSDQPVKIVETVEITPRPFPMGDLIT
jgi:DNA recombination protein RmuC